MDRDRRQFVIGAGAAMLLAGLPFTVRSGEESNMYGLIGKILAVEGQRDALAGILLDGMRDMPGCLSYIVAKDPQDENALWVTEVWESSEAHRASLSLPSVQDAIARGKPLIAGFGERTETQPLGGHGLVESQD